MKLFARLAPSIAFALVMATFINVMFTSVAAMFPAV
jgi:hypothetical protein